MDRVRVFFGRRHAPAPAARVPAPVRPRPAPAVVPVAEASLARGVRTIQRSDPGFDPSRIAGYVGMIFRATQQAWMAGEIGPLRDRLTPELHGEMQAHYDRVQRSGRVNRVAEIEITATVTEAWQEGERDYLTAHISGSIVDYTVDGARGRIVEGSSEIPRPVDEFWTFTRPAGLNFWMLSAIQTGAD
jgi:predicted lipid-binding transport protein (Tim44 family)